MTHLIVCREYPPAPYPTGGIGTYARHIVRLLAEAGDTIHMVAQRSELAPERIVRSIEGRLIVHRLSLDEPIDAAPGTEAAERRILKQLANSACPTQLFSWQAARYAERLIRTEPIDTIEGQEWEAPLYYLQMRRLCGLGPNKRPPIVVHLHSPTEMIFEANEWDRTLTDFAPIQRMEEWSIRLADALLCPSQYLAGQVSGRLRLDPARTTLIPYPMGAETPLIARPEAVWTRNSVAYVGRLELRKGVVEWVDAAVAVAATDRSVSFDFFGSDTTVGGGMGGSVLEHLKRRIPAALRHRFRFRGARSRAELMGALAETAIAVVPSRWENFPFTCVEAMSTGLPVLASPKGGMAEMIVDGESGWISAGQSAPALAEALRRALATPAEERAAMGAEAARAVRRICDNDTVIEAQLKFRRSLVLRDCLSPAEFVPWRLYGPDDLDAGPSQWPEATWPGPPMERLPRRRMKQRRFSGMALIANQTPGFALRWFLAATLTEKLRWMGRMMRQPGRVARWLSFRAGK